MRKAGLFVPVDRASLFARIIALLSPTSPGELYWCARIALLSDIDQLSIFDAIFVEIFGTYTQMTAENNNAAPQGVAAGSAVPHQSQPVSELPKRPTFSPAGDRSMLAPQVDEDLASYLDRSIASREESLTTRNLAELSEADLQLANSILGSLEQLMPTRITRRTSTTKMRPSTDIRSTLRRSVKTSGDPIKLVKRGRVEKRRSLIFIVDISGSMEPFSSPYLHFLHAISKSGYVESFVFSTQLTRITVDLRTTRTIESIFSGLSTAPDRFGGTRIAETLKTFLDTHGRRGMARGAIVIIVSDGWECGDLEQLKEQMRRIKLLAHRVLWVNPRKANSGYLPLAGGMATVLPFCDGFFSGHSIGALCDLVQSLEVSSKSPKTINWASMR
ncbi:MAG: VWA domain-containing protein [Acidimicrobiaceae bacterium]|nr:VWA domain-containing protein [Acidimicrobiaceae bacterium]